MGFASRAKPRGDGYLVLSPGTNGGFTVQRRGSNVSLSSSGGGLFWRPNSQESGRFLILGQVLPDANPPLRQIFR